MSVELSSHPETGRSVRWRIRVWMPDGRLVAGGAVWNCNLWKALERACSQALAAERLAPVAA